MEELVLFQGVAKDSLAFRLMTQMGWEEGTGLGKDKQGIKQHIRVQNRNDNSGVGVDAQKKAASNWTVNTHVFDNILKNLKVQVADSIDEEKNAEDTSEDEEVEDDVKVKVKKHARPQGRYKRREGGKLVRDYSDRDLQAILGGRGEENVARTSDAPEPLSSIVHTEIEETNVKASVSGTKKKSKLKSDTKPKGVITEEKQTEERQTETFLKDIPSNVVESSISASTGYASVDWWGTKYGFVRGGQLGSKLMEDQQTREMSSRCAPNGNAPGETRDVGASHERVAFCEQDQENLYKLVQDKATTGKQGLGVGDRPRKVGGAHWKGQKKAFDDDDDDDNNGKEAAKELHSTDRPSEDLKDKGIVRGGVTPRATTKNPQKKRKRACQSDSCDIDVLESVQKEGSKMKLKELIMQYLIEAPEQTMSLKRLQKRVMAATGLFSNRSLSSEDSADSFKDKLQKSSRFVVEGKKVFVAANRAELSDILEPYVHLFKYEFVRSPAKIYWHVYSRSSGQKLRVLHIFVMHYTSSHIQSPRHYFAFEVLNDLAERWEPATVGAKHVCFVLFSSEVGNLQEKCLCWPPIGIARVSQ